MKLNGEVTISLPNSDKNQKRVYIFPWISLFFISWIENNRRFHFSRAYVCFTMFILQ